MASITNKRLFDEIIVKKIVSSLITDALEKKIQKEDVKTYVKENFDIFVKKIVNGNKTLS